MESNPILSALNLPHINPIRFTSLQMRMWGRDLRFSCKAGLVEFKLQYTDCREMRWQVYTHLKDEQNPAFPPTELVNIKIGRNQHRSPSHLLTEHFGLSLVYGELDLIYEDLTIPLGTE
jgi:hypothetical protein